MKQKNIHSFTSTRSTQTVYVCVSAVCVGEKLLDLLVSAQRPVCVGSKHSGIMGDEVGGQGQEHNTVCIVYLCVLEER